MESTKIFRYEFSTGIMESLSTFSKQYKDVDRHAYKEAWSKWLEENNRPIIDEETRLKQDGYEGDIRVKMYKSSRYYFRKKSTEKKAPTERKKYVALDKPILMQIDRHITNNIEREDFKPSVGFSEFCELEQTAIQETTHHLQEKGITGCSNVREKLKKTYKNRYFVIHKGGVGSTDNTANDGGYDSNDTNNEEEEKSGETKEDAEEMRLKHLQEMRTLRREAEKEKID